MLSNHHGLKLDFNNNRNNKKAMSSWKLNNSLLNDYRVKAEIKKGIKDFLEFNILKLMEHNKSSAKSKVHITKCLYKGIKELELSHASNIPAHLSCRTNINKLIRDL